MLTRVLLKNFKLHAETEIEFAPITVFIGPNNSGKSSVFQALLALRQAAERNDSELFRPSPVEALEKLGFESLKLLNKTMATEGQPPPLEWLVDLGAFEDVVRAGEGEIAIGFSGSLPIEQVRGVQVAIDVSAEAHVQDNSLAFHTGYLGSAGKRYAWTLGPHGFKVPVEHHVLTLRTQPSFQFIESSGLEFVHPAPLSPKRQAELTSFGQKIGSAPTDFLRSLRPIFPLRGFEQWGFPLPDAAHVHVEKLTLAERAAAIVSILAYNDAALERLSDWLQALLGVRLKKKLLPPKRIAIRAEATGLKGEDIPFTGEGTGANQMPFIMLPIGLAAPTDTMMISEPEAHLHPKAQTALTRLLLAIHKKENRQFAIETHSEHVLHAFLHAVASGELERERLAIYYFTPENGVAKVRRLEIDEKGRVAGGLPGFFEHSLSELSAYLDTFGKE